MAMFVLDPAPAGGWRGQTITLHFCVLESIAKYFKNSELINLLFGAFPLTQGKKHSFLKKITSGQRWV